MISMERGADMVSFECNGVKYNMTEQEIEAAYRYRLHQYRMEDARRQLNMKKLWMRAGITLTLTDEEVEAILGGNDRSAGEKAIEAALRDGRFSFDGESYIPQPTVEDFVREHGLAYATQEPEFCLGLEGFQIVVGTKKGV